ncbi:M28 family peptidase [Sphingomonadaceae bacterium OTU29MARTA1]|nr:M28 family peptidase [Sphingomonadaceae bacterium OTU29MARTA1]
MPRHPVTQRGRTPLIHRCTLLAGRRYLGHVLVLSAHLDHLGVGADGTIWPGANDDASGTVRCWRSRGLMKRGAVRC